MHQNEIFAVCERIHAMDGRIYLLLADGRGWAFDDSAVMPHDPSVLPHHPPVICPPIQLELASMMVFDEPLGGTEAMTKCSRRKRGGVKHKKRKFQADPRSKTGVESMSE